MLPQTCSPCSIYWDGFCHCLDNALILLHLKFLGYVHLHLITQCDLNGFGIFSNYEILVWQVFCYYMRILHVA